MQSEESAGSQRGIDLCRRAGTGYGNPRGHLIGVAARELEPPTARFVGRLFFLENNVINDVIYYVVNNVILCGRIGRLEEKYSRKSLRQRIAGPKFFLALPYRQAGNSFYS